MEQTKTMHLNSLIDNLTRLKRDAYAKLDQALNLDQSNEPNDTKIIMYESSLILIEKALSFNKENHMSGLNENEDAIKIVKQLNEMKKLTIERLEHLKKMNSANKLNEEEFLNISDDCLLVDDDDDDDGDDVIIIDSPNKNNNEKNKLNLKDFEKANEILRLENSVQQFFIGSDGTVSTPSHLTDISIYTFENGLNLKKVGKNIVGFIKVNNWMYPIVPDESPAMKTNFNAYIFPNNDQLDANTSFIGITFAKNVPTDNLMFFEDILASYSSLIYQDATQPEGVKRPLVNSATSESLQPNSKKIEQEINQPKSKSNEQLNITENQANSMKSSLTAENFAKILLSGAENISKGVSSTTEYANKYLQQGGEKLKSNTVPNAEPAKIDPKLKTAVSTVRYGSHLTVRVSNFLVSQLKSICTSTGKALAPHIRDGSKYVLNQTGMQSDKSSSYIDGTCKVASSAIEGFGIVYDSLEGAAKQLGKSFTEQSVTIVNHKYGSDAANLTENSLYAAGNVAQSVNNFQNLKIIRTLAKTTAKETLLANKTNKNANTDLSTQSEKK